MFSSRRRAPLTTALAAAAAALLAVAAPASAAPSPVSSQRRNVINGTVVPRPSVSAPWALSLSYAPSSTATPRFICTATAVGPLEVLTAAHCVSTGGFYYVRVGTDMLGRGRLVPVEAVDVNGGYGSRTTKDDVAMLRPLERLDLRSYAHLATPTMAASVRAGRLPTLTLFGWGRTERGELTGELRTASLVRQTHAAVVEFGDWFIDPMMLAAGRWDPATKRYFGACHGDSGGPLIVSVGGVPYVVGVTSFGTADCLAPAPTVFTSVGNYASWIGTSRRNLPVLALRDNRAVPIMRTAPAISGTVSVGATLTCGPGTWTANAHELTYAWTRGPVFGEIARGAQYVVTRADAGRKLMCNVGAASQAGTATASASITAENAPTVTFGQTATITGLSAYADPQPDRTASCGAPSFEPSDAVLSYAWFSQLGTARLPLAVGPTLLLSKDLMLALQGRQLACDVTATNAMGSTVVSAVAGMPVLAVPSVYALVPSVPLAAGSAAACVATPNQAAAALSYEWAIEPGWSPGATAFTASARVLGVGPTYTLTDADVVVLGSGGARLACRATATMWQGSASAVSVMS